MANSSQVDKYTSKLEDLTQAGGATTLEMGQWRAPMTQVSFSFTGNTDDLGSLAFHVKYHPDANWEVLLDAAGAARTVTLSDADLQSFTIVNNWVHEIRVTPTGVTGSYSMYCYQDALALGREHY